MDEPTESHSVANCSLSFFLSNICTHELPIFGTGFPAHESFSCSPCDVAKVPQLAMPLWPIARPSTYHLGSKICDRGNGWRPNVMRHFAGSNVLKTFLGVFQWDNRWNVDSWLIHGWMRNCGADMCWHILHMLTSTGTWKDGWLASAVPSLAWRKITTSS